MAVSAVVFEADGTLAGEVGARERYADAAGVRRFTSMAYVGSTTRRGESRSLRSLDVLPEVLP